jgi:hypothetical protein
MIRVAYPESGYQILFFYPIPGPGSRRQKGTGSRIRIRNTAAVLWAWNRSDSVLSGLV